MIYTDKIMKSLRLFAIIASIALASSCQKFLDLVPPSSSTVASFYKSQADFMQAVNGTYASLRDQYGYGYYMLFTDLRSDNTTISGAGGAVESQKLEIDNFTIPANNEHLLTYWRVSYQALQKANGVLSHIDGVDFDKAKKDQFIGESKVIRALTYFNLVRMFGGVPLIKVGDVSISASYNVPRSTVDEVYSFIISDLTEAIPLLPETYSTDEAGRITKGAAQSLLGQVYMTVTPKKYTDAAIMFGSVISGGNYGLLSKYEDNFTGDNQGNSEAILQILFKRGGMGLGSSYPNWCAPPQSETILVRAGGAYGFNQPTQDILNAYPVGDLRKDASVGVGFTTADKIFINALYIKLYVNQDPGEGGNDSDADWSVLRYSHVLLMCAEALNESNNGPTPAAYTYINLVRARAGLIVPLSGLSQSAFRDAVYSEERLEVAFEGQRWFDLIRTGRAVAVMNSKITDNVGLISAINENQLLYPIPQAVITQSAPGVITQNPGY
jgi:hypothetical protein